MAEDRDRQHLAAVTVSDEQATPALPPWNWTRLSSVLRQVEMEDLAAWVAELQEAYGRWVRLPDCWPCHRALRDELAAFWYWRQGLDRNADAPAEELVRWHQNLRVSAQAWAEAFGGCRHESMGEVDETRDAREGRLTATKPYLARAIAHGGAKVAGDLNAHAERMSDHESTSLPRPAREPGC